MNQKFKSYLKLFSSLIGIVAVIVVMLSGDEISSHTSATVGSFGWHECTLSMAAHSSSDCSDTPVEQSTDDESSEKEKEKEKEKEEKENEKKTEYEDGVLGCLHSIAFESSIVRTYFHHHCPIISSVIIDKPTQPPKIAPTA